MNGKVILIAGITLLILSVIIDYIGLGFKPGFGAAQIAGIIIGIALIVFGILRLKPKK